MLKTADDRSLLTANDEHAAFKIIYDRYWESLYRKAVARLGDTENAQDAVQEVFISLWRNRHTIQIEETLAPYLFTALKYCIIKKVCRQAAKGLQLPLSVDDLKHGGNVVEENFRYKELLQLVGKEVAQLPERMQEIYRLSREQNFSSKEIAKQLLISEQTVKNTLSTTLKRLRLRLMHFFS